MRRVCASTKSFEAVDQLESILSSTVTDYRSLLNEALQIGTQIFSASAIASTSNEGEWKFTKIREKFNIPATVKSIRNEVRAVLEEQLPQTVKK